jgi:hypothetical protein
MQLLVLYNIHNNVYVVLIVILSIDFGAQNLLSSPLFIILLEFQGVNPLIENSVIHRNHLDSFRLNIELGQKMLLEDFVVNVKRNTSYANR